MDSAERGNAPRKPHLSRELVDALLPPVTPAAVLPPIVINLAAGAVLHLHIGAAGKKEE